MTVPIQEPTTQRSISGAEWATSQLARRPPIVNAAGYPWIAIFNGATTAPTATYMPVPFTQLAYDPALVTLGVGIFDVDTTDTGDPGNTRYRIKTLRKGVYYVELWTTWGSVATDGANTYGYAAQSIFHTSLPNGLLAAQEDPRSSADWPKNDTTSDFEMQKNPFLFTTWTVFLNQGSWTWDPYAIQTTGIDRDLSGTRLYVSALPFSNDATWVFDSI